jgi:DNA-binding XRE family transcriptional regulator
LCYISRMDIETIQNVDIDPAKLKAARGERSVPDVAKLFNIHRKHIYAIESGSRKPSSPLLIKLCLLYDVGLKDIIRDEKKLLAVESFS